MLTHRAVTAMLQLLPTSAGGKSIALRSGYRGQIAFDGSSDVFGFQVELLSTSELAPGASGTAKVLFWAGHLLPELSAGMTFEIRDGIKPVGSGKIIDVLPSV